MYIHTVIHRYTHVHAYVHVYIHTYITLYSVSFFQILQLHVQKWYFFKTNIQAPTPAIVQITELQILTAHYNNYDNEKDFGSTINRKDFGLLFILSLNRVFYGHRFL